jgi:hypothetical protein
MFSSPYLCIFLTWNIFNDRIKRACYFWHWFETSRYNVWNKALNSFSHSSHEFISPFQQAFGWLAHKLINTCAQFIHEAKGISYYVWADYDLIELENGLTNVIH